MALSFYDEAILDKLKKWVLDPKMTITGPDETRRVFEYQADVESDSPIKLPLITLRRGREITILSTNKKPLTFDGLTLNANLKKSDQLNAVPISLNYQIDIYSRYFKEADGYFRDFIFNIINHPKIVIQIPYNDAVIEHTANIRLEQTAMDNSDISERLFTGQFTRFTIPVYVDDAYLFDYKIRNNYDIKYEFELSEELK